ncbi:MAG: response regulator, partial [Reyranella sp.]
YLRVSPSVRAVLGYAPEEMEGRSARDFTHPADLEATRGEVRAAKRGQATHSFRSRYIHKDGHVVPMDWTSVWSEDDRRLFLVGRDMTESDRRETELRQAQKMEAVGQLTGGVAHDFNNILMVIQANVEALEEEPALPRDLRGKVDGIGRAAGRAAELTRQLLAFSRKQTLSPRLTDLNALVAETSRLLARTLGARIEIGLELAADAWPVEIDRGQLDAALVNLALNARDAMPSGGKLTVATRNVTLSEAEARSLSDGSDLQAGRYVVLAVTDTGIGMAPEIRDKVFEPFFTTKEFGRGTGLGLSMVYGFIRQSRGHVAIRSAPGEGTTFSLYLPRSLADAQQAAPDASARADEKGGPERILVVEDDAQVRAGIVTLLQSLGYVALEAADAEQGLAVLAAAGENGGPPVDLVLTDVIMPGTMTGRGLAEETARRFPEVRLVFMTGYSELGQQAPLAPEARL